MKKYINRLLIGLNLVLWVTWHLVIIAVKVSHDTGHEGFVWFFGISLQGSIFIDSILFIGIIINLILLMVIE